MHVYIKPFSRYMTATCSSSSYFLHRRFYADKRSSLNHYHVLGVESSASSKEIKAAFYRLSKKYHPDVNTEDVNATSKFNTISNAYDILNDPIKRREYDNQLISRTSTPDPYIYYNRTSPYAQRARAHRPSARQTSYSANGFQGNTRTTNHGSFDQRQYEADQPGDSDSKDPVNEEEEEEDLTPKPPRIVISKIFLFSLLLTFGLAAYTTSNLFHTMHFQQQIEEFPSRLVSVPRSSRKSSAKI